MTELSPPGAFVRAYPDLAPALRAWAVLRCRGPLGRALEPDDLVQEVCLEAMAAEERFDPARGEFRPWLFGIASRVASNALRRLARGRLLPADTSLASRTGRLPADVTTVSRRVRHDEAVSAFLRDLDELDEDDRRLLVHRGIEALEHAEIAALLGISAENAAKRWQRLRERVAAWPTARSVLADC